MIPSSSSLNPLILSSKFKSPLCILNSFPFSSLSAKFTTTIQHHCNSNNHQVKPSNAIDQIVLRFRNLTSPFNHNEKDDAPTQTLLSGHFLHREWIRSDEAVIPSENEVDRQEDKKVLKKKKKKKERKEVIASCLAEEELSRLRTMGMHLKEKVSVPQAGLTRPVLQKIHHQWNNNELVRLKFHEILAQNMNLAHHIVECRTGGIVIWRSGSVMWVYRGNNYQGKITGNKHNSKGGDEKNESVVFNQQHPENTTPEEMEFNRMLDDFGPRFVDWWGTGILPVDADLLPPTVPGYRTPLRILPTKMNPRLTNKEHTKMLKLAKALPCHFALGRNRNLQGLACAILKLWEKSLVAKIAVKLGVQNTNNELMALELKKLTGGTLLLRNKYYIVIYRGKDFIPTSVASTLSGEDKTYVQAGLLAEFYEARAPWGRDLSTKECEMMTKEASNGRNVKLMKKIENKLAVIHEHAETKKSKAEKLQVKIDASSIVPGDPDNRRETITDEERAMFRVAGLRMKAYLQLGTHDVFDGVVKNMHLHWRHRELVKLIAKQKDAAFVEEIANVLEYKSGGILVTIDRIPKGFSLIYYRGKNYRRNIYYRRNILTKAMHVGMEMGQAARRGPTPNLLKVWSGRRLFVK